MTNKINLMDSFNVQSFRQQFPILARKVNGSPLIYGDNAATCQKPTSVISAIERYYHQCNANVHRASHALSSEATRMFEQTRILVQNFINASSLQEIIWTKGTTESINLVAQSWGRDNLTKGDEILVSYGEHHANIVPWQLVAEQTGAVVRVIPLDEYGVIDIDIFKQLLNAKTKFVSINHISNVIGKINPVERVIEQAHAVGALVLVDGAQAVAHQNIDVKKLNCDFYAFSSHKMYAPSGIGVLFGKKEILNAMPPYQAGGEMIKKVSFSGTSFNNLPFKFEAGTPNISGVVGFGEAIAFLNSTSTRKSYEQALLDYTYQQLSDIPQLSFIVTGKPDIAIFSFVIEELHNQDVASYLDAHGIAVRSGHHCAMPLMEHLHLNGCVRLSLAAYNTYEEVDYIVSCLKRLISGDVSDNDEVAEHDEIIALFNKAKSWDSKHREIMLLGKKLPRLTEEFKTSEAVIDGCESTAWLTYIIDHEGKYHFSADSNAKVIRGLLYIVLAKYQCLTSSEINQVDIDGYFSELGLLQHLSPSRGNGLNAIVDKIKRLAQS